MTDRAAHSEPSLRPRRRWWQRLVRWCVLTVLVMIGAYVALPWWLPIGYLRDHLERDLEHQVGLDVEIGEIHLNWSGAELHDVTFAQPEGFGPGIMVSAGRVRAAFSPLYMLAGGSPEWVEVEDVEIDGRLDAEGRLNLAAIDPRTMDLQPGRLSVCDGHVRLQGANDETPLLELRLADLQFRPGDPGRPGYLTMSSQLIQGDRSAPLAMRFAPQANRPGRMAYGYLHFAEVDLSRLPKALLGASIRSLAGRCRGELAFGIDESLNLESLKVEVLASDLQVESIAPVTLPKIDEAGLRLDANLDVLAERLNVSRLQIRLPGVDLSGSATLFLDALAGRPESVERLELAGTIFPHRLTALLAGRRELLGGIDIDGPVDLDLSLQSQGDRQGLRLALDGRSAVMMRGGEVIKPSGRALRADLDVALRLGRQAGEIRSARFTLGGNTLRATGRLAGPINHDDEESPVRAALAELTRLQLTGGVTIDDPASVTALFAAQTELALNGRLQGTWSLTGQTDRALHFNLAAPAAATLILGDTRIGPTREACRVDGDVVLLPDPRDGPTADLLVSGLRAELGEDVSLTVPSGWVRLTPLAFSAGPITLTAKRPRETLAELGLTLPADPLGSIEWTGRVWLDETPHVRGELRAEGFALVTKSGPIELRPPGPIVVSAEGLDDGAWRAAAELDSELLQADASVVVRDAKVQEATLSAGGPSLRRVAARAGLAAGQLGDLDGRFLVGVSAEAAEKGWRISGRVAGVGLSGRPAASWWPTLAKTSMNVDFQAAVGRETGPAWSWADGEAVVRVDGSTLRLADLRGRAVTVRPKGVPVVELPAGPLESLAGRFQADLDAARFASLLAVDAETRIGGRLAADGQFVLGPAGLSVEAELDATDVDAWHGQWGKPEGMPATASLTGWVSRDGRLMRVADASARVGEISAQAQGRARLTWREGYAGLADIAPLSGRLEAKLSDAAVVGRLHPTLAKGKPSGRAQVSASLSSGQTGPHVAIRASADKLRWMDRGTPIALDGEIEIGGLRLVRPPLPAPVLATLPAWAQGRWPTSAEVVRVRDLEIRHGTNHGWLVTDLTGVPFRPAGRVEVLIDRLDLAGLQGAPARADPLPQMGAEARANLEARIRPWLPLLLQVAGGADVSWRVLADDLRAFDAWVGETYDLRRLRADGSLKHGKLNLEATVGLNAGAVQLSIASDVGGRDPHVDKRLVLNSVRSNRAFQPQVQAYFPGNTVGGTFSQDESVRITLLEQVATLLDPRYRPARVGKAKMIATDGVVVGQAAPDFLTKVFPGLNLAEYHYDRMTAYTEYLADGSANTESIFTGLYNVYMAGTTGREGDAKYTFGLILLGPDVPADWQHTWKQGRVPLFKVAGRIDRGKLVDDEVTYPWPNETLGEVFIENNFLVRAWQKLEAQKREQENRR